jgi:hypothetical protein
LALIVVVPLPSVQGVVAAAVVEVDRGIRAK